MRTARAQHPAECLVMTLGYGLGVWQDVGTGRPLPSPRTRLGGDVCGQGAHPGAGIKVPGNCSCREQRGRQHPPCWGPGSEPRGPGGRGRPGQQPGSSLPYMRCAQGVAGLWGHLAAPIKKEAGQLSQKCQSQSSGHHESPSTVLLSLQRPQAPLSGSPCWEGQVCLARSWNPQSPAGGRAEAAA